MTDNDILAVFGSTEADPAARLTAAKFRYQQSIDTGHSPFDVAAQLEVTSTRTNGITPARPEAIATSTQ